MFNALDVIKSFQDGEDGWDDKTVIVLLAQFIDGVNIAERMADFFARHVTEPEV